MSNANNDVNLAVQMETRPLVSIVTPVYNQCEYLEATMRSVLEQDYPELEYIVIDDGSQDESLLVAERIASEFPGRVTVLSQSNCGQAATLNKGWAIAQGEILSYLSSDDCLLPHAISYMVDALQKKSEIGVAYCDFRLIDELGKTLRNVHTENFDSKRMTVNLICQPGPGAFFRRGVFKHTMGWNKNLSQVPDFDFWLRATKVADFIRVPYTLAEYRIHEGSASFRQMSEIRAEEIINVVQLYWSNNENEYLMKKAMAHAHVIAAKNHAQSGRVVKAIKFFLNAFKLYPSLVGQAGVWRQFFSGFLRRILYLIRIRINKILG